MKELTVIITFLNENVEVERTLASLKKHTNSDIDIILVNDHSDDYYDYKGVAQNYNALYVENRIRMGVAASRDKGVSMVKTPFALLLDAHMRFYSDNWYDILMRNLHANSNILFCCQSKVLYKVCEEIKSVQSTYTTGAFINMDVSSNGFLGVSWLCHQKESGNNETIDIPCVLGAGYAFSVDLWKKIHGLNGLIKYGLDEQFISLKVWLSGGKCQLIPNIELGHVYRDFAPYEMSALEFIYNKMLITSLIFPEPCKYEVFARFRTKNSEIYEKAYKLILTNQSWIKKEKSYLKSIFTRNWKDVYDMNTQYLESSESEKADIELMFRTILLADFTKDFAIFDGNCGKLLVCMLWTKWQKSEFFEKLSCSLYEKIINHVTTFTGVNMSNGLLSLGWTIEFLNQNKLINCNTNEVLRDIDEKVLTLNCKRIKDTSLGSGVRGIIAYVYARILGCRQSCTSSPFDDKFVNDLLEIAENLAIDAKYQLGLCELECDFIKQCKQPVDYHLGKKDVEYIQKQLFPSENIIYKAISELYSIVY